MNLPDTRLFNRQIDCNASANNETDFVLLFAGTVSKRNGLSNVISAMPLLKEKIPNIKFRIIGTGEYVDDLKKLVAQLQLLQWVLFDKPVPLTQIPAEILLSDAVIWLPTKNEFTDIVMSTKTLEALIMGKPVITTRTTCHDYYFGGEDVIYIDPVNTENIVHTIVNLYGDLDKRNYFFDNSAKIASKFSWDFEKQRYFELLDRLNHRKKY